MIIDKTRITKEEWGIIARLLDDPKSAEAIAVIADLIGYRDPRQPEDIATANHTNGQFSLLALIEQAVPMSRASEPETPFVG